MKRHFPYVIWLNEKRYIYNKLSLHTHTHDVNSEWWNYGLFFLSAFLYFLTFSTKNMWKYVEHIRENCLKGFSNEWSNQ